MKINLTKTEIDGILKALYTEKAEIVKVKRLYDVEKQSHDEEYINNQELRVKFESILRDYGIDRPFMKLL